MATKRVQNITQLLLGKERKMKKEVKKAMEKVDKSVTYYAEVKRLLEALGIKRLACMIDLVVRDKFPEDSEHCKAARKFWKATSKVEE